MFYDELFKFWNVRLRKTPAVAAPAATPPPVVELEDSGDEAVDVSGIFAVKEDPYECSSPAPTSATSGATPVTAVGDSPDAPDTLELLLDLETPADTTKGTDVKGECAAATCTPSASAGSQPASVVPSTKVYESLKGMDLNKVPMDVIRQRIHLLQYLGYVNLLMVLLSYFLRPNRSNLPYPSLAFNYSPNSVCTEGVLTVRVKAR